jgi:tRNA A-37 threonylcarbamoyl transferase component Bud32
MGEVYLATAVGPDGVEKPVAIKLVRDHLLRRRELREQFIEEAKISFLLTHPNVVQTYELGQVDDHHFLVMEYVDCTTLEEVLEFFRERLGQPLPLSFALYVASQVARGLSYAHTLKDAQGRGLGIVHRDVSPGNVLLSRDGQVKVSDFGLATSVLRKMESEGGVVKGKLAYMAPEQLAGRRVGQAADIYSLGVVMHEMISGQHPFGALRELTLERRRGQREVGSLGEAAPHLDREVVELVDRCVEPDPGDRPGSALELGRRIDRYVRQAGLAVSDYELAEFIQQARQEARARPPTPHPFDRALGMELQRVAGEGGVSTFLAVSSADAEADAGRDANGGGDEWTEATALIPESQTHRRSGLRLVLWVVLAAAALGGALALLAGRLPPSTAGTAPADASVAADGGPPPARDRGPDRGAPVPDLAPAADLVPAADSRRARRPVRRTPGEAPQPTGWGSLSVNTEPWSIVYLDGRRVGSTPIMRLRVRAGQHRVRMVNPPKKLEARRTVQVLPEQEALVTLELK